MYLFRYYLFLVAVTLLLGYIFNPLGSFYDDLAINETQTRRTTNNVLRKQSINHDNKPNIPLPVRIFDTYKEEHGIRTLRNEQSSPLGLDPSRKYAIASYWCPDRSGNVMHNLFNTVTWAVITNRTILLQWVQPNPSKNTMADCEEALQKKSWIPLWENWKDLIPADPIIPIDIDASRSRLDEVHTTVLFPQSVAYQSISKIYNNKWNSHPFRPEYREYIENLPEDKNLIAQGLQSLGVDFLYGMMFRHMFDIVPEGGKLPIQQNDFSVLLHSRHVAQADDGSIISDEVKCLNELVPKRVNNFRDETTISWSQGEKQDQGQFTGCTIFLLSDREATIEKLTSWIQQEIPFCVAKRTKYPKAKKTPSQLSEHGPNPGIGFFYDLAMGAQARSATIGDEKRSSFKLVKELVVYDRIMERVSSSTANDQWRDSLLHCELPGRFPSGYDYGPGTVRFVSQNHLPELFPTTQWRYYREIHSQQAIEGEMRQINFSRVPTSRRFASLKLSCPINTDQALEQISNWFLWSLLSNTTLLIQPSTGNDQTCLSKLPSWIPRWDQWSEKINLPSDLPAVPTLDSLVPKSHRELPSFDSMEKNNSTKQLFHYGQRFVRGMILRDILQKTMELNSFGRRSESDLITDPIYSVAVDTRNLPISTSSGASQILECLSRILSNASVPTSAPSNCNIFIISSSNATARYWETTVMDHVKNEGFVQFKNGCTVQSSPRAAFWNAWGWGSRARNAWIGPKSSIIPAEMEFQHVMETRSIGRFPMQLSELATCYTEKEKDMVAL